MILPLVLTGCRGFGKPDTQYDLLTAELRTRDRELQEARAELNQLKLLNQAYQRNGTTAPCPPGLPGSAVPAYHEPQAPALPLSGITIGAGTGGVNQDNSPGDESLMVAIVPKDPDGTPIKVPAKVVVLVSEISREGRKCPIGRWDISPEQLRRTWKSGLLSSGYFIPLQWDQPPGTNQIRITAQLSTLDGHTFEADKDVTVTPLPGIAPHQ